MFREFDWQKARCKNCNHGFSVGEEIQWMAVGGEEWYQHVEQCPDGTVVTDTTLGIGDESH